MTTLQARLAALPTVEGAVGTATDATDGSVAETFQVPSGAPACRQILSRLDAAGYPVVTGTSSESVAADSCLTTTGNDAVGIDRGSGTILAAGGSQIALSWTSTTYTVTASR